MLCCYFYETAPLVCKRIKKPRKSHDLPCTTLFTDGHCTTTATSKTFLSNAYLNTCVYGKQKCPVQILWIKTTQLIQLLHCNRNTQLFVWCFILFVFSFNTIYKNKRKNNILIHNARLHLEILLRQCAYFFQKSKKVGAVIYVIIRRVNK